MVGKLSKLFVHKNKRVRSVSAVKITVSGVASNKSVNQTEFVAVCFLRLQCAAGYLKRYAKRI